MRILATTLSALLITAIAQAQAKHGFRFTTGESFLPAMRAIVVVKAGDPAPGAARHKAIAATSKYKETVGFTDDGPFDLWWQPKVGIAVKVLGNVKLKEDEIKEVKIDDHVGVVTVRGDGQPRAGLVTIAPQDDPGPDEKGHKAVQTAKDYRVDMVAPPGFYSLWVTPDNGARPKKINDRFRVDAGKSLALD
jgi:hypothetical protein